MVPDLFGNAVAMATELNPTWTYSDCNGASAGSNGAAATVPNPGGSFVFKHTFTYWDCSWRHDPLSTAANIVAVSARDADPEGDDYTCTSTSASYSQGDGWGDDSKSWYIQTNCVMYCNNQFELDFYHSIAAKGNAATYGEATLYENPACA